MCLDQDQQLDALVVKQVEHNGVLVPSPPDWFISCGLGVGGPEVKRCHKAWPGTRVVGVDPDPAVVRSVRSYWRPTDVLVEVALSDSIGRGQASFRDGPSHGTLHPQMVERSQTTTDVTTTTLDELDSIYGPFDRAVLWVDAEGYDYKILKGAEGLLRRGAVWAVVVEIWTARPDLIKHYSSMRARLFSLGFHLADILNPEWWGHNEIYLCDELATELVKAG